MSIGNNILKLRKMNNVSQSELADYLHVSRQTISKFERELSLPDMDMILKICEFFDISLNELLGIEDSDSINDLYNQLQNVSENIIKNNRKTKYLNIIIIIICIISLGLSMYMVNRIYYYDQLIYKMNNNSHTYFNDTIVNNIVDDSVFIIGNNSSYMNTEICNLSDEKITFDFQFTLREYSDNTSVKIQLLSNWDDEEVYELKKKSKNQFVFNKELDLKNYDEMNLIINDGNNNIKNVSLVDYQTEYGNTGQYFRKAIEDNMHLYIPYENNQLVTNKIIYEPVGKFSNSIYRGYFKKGAVVLQLFDSSYNQLLYTTFDLGDRKEISLNSHLNINEDIYIKLGVNFESKDSGSYYGIIDSSGVGGKVTSSFVIEDQQADFDIFF